LLRELDSRAEALQTLQRALEAKETELGALQRRLQNAAEGFQRERAARAAEIGVLQRRVEELQGGGNTKKRKHDDFDPLTEAQIRRLTFHELEAQLKAIQNQINEGGDNRETTSRLNDSRVLLLADWNRRKASENKQRSDKEPMPLGTRQKASAVKELRKILKEVGLDVPSRITRDNLRKLSKEARVLLHPDKASQKGVRGRKLVHVTKVFQSQEALFKILLK
jgi:hypothetical protein